MKRQIFRLRLQSAAGSESVLFDASVFSLVSIRRAFRHLPNTSCNWVMGSAALVAAGADTPEGQEASGNQAVLDLINRWTR